MGAGQSASKVKPPPAVAKTPRTDEVTDLDPGASRPWLAPGSAVLTLAAADEMASTALREANMKGFKPISVVVLDASGRALVQKTDHRCPKLPPELAHGKASLAVGMHTSSRALRDKYVPEKTPQLLAMSIIGSAAHQPLAAFPGGVLCRDPEGSVVGAIGVSGAAADEDEHCAIAAAHAVGLRTEPAASALQ